MERIRYEKIPDKSLGSFVLQFFTNSQQQYADDYDCNKNVSLPRELLFQEDAGEQQGNNADGGKNGSSNGIYTAKCINVGELTAGFKYCSKDLVPALLNGSKFNFLCLHEDEQAQCKQSEGQLIAGVCYSFNGIFSHVYQRRACYILDQEECIVQECTECIQQGINERHAEGNHSQLLAVLSLSFLRALRCCTPD